MTTSDTTNTAAALLTFPPMIDSEACRFILNCYGIPYRETPHVFGWASVLSLFSGSTGRIPVLRGKDYRLAGPHQLVEYFEPRCPTERKLIPAEKTLADQVEADWNLYNGDLAGATAVFAYYHLLPHRKIMIEPFSRGVPSLEARIMRAIYPVFAGLFRLLLQLTATHAEEALAKVRAVFDETDRKVADGRRYLVGGRLTFADIGLATAAAPVLVPEGYGSPIPPVEQMPVELSSVVAEMRQHETARFVQRIYREHRNG
jgi:glutathione S-transferase